jgi:YbbR domain-containing protein
VNVAAAPVERRIAGVKVEGRNGGTRTVQVRPAAVTVVVRGAHEVVDTLDAARLEAVVDLEGLGQGQFQLPVRVTPPQHVAVVRVEPAQVTVRVP